MCCYLIWTEFSWRIKSSELLLLCKHMAPFFSKLGRLYSRFYLVYKTCLTDLLSDWVFQKKEAISVSLAVNVGELSTLTEDGQFNPNATWTAVTVRIISIWYLTLFIQAVLFLGLFSHLTRSLCFGRPPPLPRRASLPRYKKNNCSRITEH